MIVNVNPWSIAGGSGALYFVGQFDGTRFIPEDVPPAGSDPAQYQWLDHGADYYAAGTFSNAPAGKALTIGWMSNWDYASDVPTSPWRGAMALPRELALKTIDGKPRLTSTPAQPYASLVSRSAGIRIKKLEVSSAMRDLAPRMHGAVQNIELTVRPGTAQRAGLIVRGSATGNTGTRIYYDARKQTLVVDRSRSGNTWFSGAFSKEHIVDLPLRDGELHLQVVIDRNSVEVFADHGRTAITDLIFPSLDVDSIGIFAEDGDAMFSDIAVVNPS
jgi:levanbiose-producing levanase